MPASSSWNCAAAPLVLGLLLLPGCAPAGSDTTTSDSPGEPHQIVIRGHDYAFELEGPVSAGPVQVVFENVGAVPHEVVLVQLNEGVTAEEVARAFQGESDPRALVAGVAGILIADPGETAPGKLLVEFEAGRTYALLCNFTDTDDAPPHIALGMMRVFQAI